jgi:alpha(1,3/1,4) fucosyltransferase
MLTIAISYYPDDDLFFSGKNQTALLLTELFTQLGHHVSLIHAKQTDTMWWKDYPTLSHIPTLLLRHASNFDYFIDIDGLIHPDSRNRVSKRSIVFLRTFVQFSEMDQSVYFEDSYVPRYFDQLYEIWCWDLLNPIETLDSIQTLFSCPLRTVPFVWSPTVMDHFKKPKTGQPQGISYWKIHVAEKNKENTSSSILPLVAIHELVFKNIIYAKYFVHNMERIQENKFLKENVFDNIELSKLPIEFVPKQAYHEWTEHDVILFSHSRFVPIQLRLLQAIWLGIPVIHNSPILQELHPVLRDMFYHGNQVDQICQTFLHVSCNYQAFYQALPDIQATILQRWSISSQLTSWNTISQQLETNLSTVSTETGSTVSRIPLKSKIIVSFSDMWPGFNYNHNFIIDALRHEIKQQGLSSTVEGVLYSKDSQPDLVIFGPYSTEWRDIPSSIPKIYFSGENWTVPDDSSISLYLTSSRKEDDKHIRIPTWMTFIDWYSDSKELPSNHEDNPIRIPLHFAMTPHSIPFENRSEFCGFVVSNPVCGFRNETFQRINEYKRVNSGGHLYNNIGGPLELKYPGGGCGDISKHHFFANHRFTISFENSQADGYITEKVLHAKMAGCVPLYWGDKHTQYDFVEGSIVNLSHLSSPEQVLSVLQKLEENPALCSKIASTPLLNSEKKQKALQAISSMSKKLLSLIPSSAVELLEQVEPVEPFEPLDAKATSIAKIDHVFAINLDSRSDRWNNLLQHEPYLKQITTRVSAIDGKSLRMNSFLYQLFQYNDFHWKKSVMGCSLSHITTWTKIVKQTGHYFLVLEDDVRFDKDWLSRWNIYAEHIPEDAELLYLGGVLPPNKGVLPQVLEKVNDYWSVIRPNTLFSPHPLPVFHFCAYSYILSKKGAEKLVQFVQQNERKAFTSIDHVIGHFMVGLKKYIATPLVSHCFQENDPVYVQSQFDDLRRKDQFDSDIWNNTECFTEEEIQPFASQATEITTTINTPIQTVTDTTTDIKKQTMEVYYFKTNDEPFELYESKWLEELLGTNIQMKPLLEWTQLIPNDSWVLVNRPHSFLFSSYFQMLQEHSISFKVIHLSDEFLQDCIDFYSFPNCKAVLRNYDRSDVPNLPHIRTIPLGYHHRALPNMENKTIEDRKLIWTFHGTNWFGRSDILSPFMDLTPHHCLLTPSWNHPTMLKEQDYLLFLSNTKIVPILRGNHVETFRLYEALESGCIPLFITEDLEHPFCSWLSLLHIPVCKKEDAKQIMESLLESTVLESMRRQIYQHWMEYKQSIQTQIRPMLSF